MRRIILGAAVSLLVASGSSSCARPPEPPKLVATGRITGKVVDKRGEPFAFAEIALEPEAGSTYSAMLLADENGTFRFLHVPVGCYKLWVFSDGFRGKESILNIGVGAGSVQRFTLTLMPLWEPREIQVPSAGRDKED